MPKDCTLTSSVSTQQAWMMGVELVSPRPTGAKDWAVVVVGVGHRFMFTTVNRQEIESASRLRAFLELDPTTRSFLVDVATVVVHDMRLHARNNRRLLAQADRLEDRRAHAETIRST